MGIGNKENPHSLVMQTRGPQSCLQGSVKSAVDAEDTTLLHLLEGLSAVRCPGSPSSLHLQHL